MLVKNVGLTVKSMFLEKYMKFISTNLIYTFCLRLQCLNFMAHLLIHLLKPQ